MSVWQQFSFVVTEIPIKSYSSKTRTPSQVIIAVPDNSFIRSTNQRVTPHHPFLKINWNGISPYSRLIPPNAQTHTQIKFPEYPCHTPEKPSHFTVKGLQECTRFSMESLWAKQQLKCIIQCCGLTDGHAPIPSFKGFWHWSSCRRRTCNQLKCWSAVCYPAASTKAQQERTSVLSYC